MDSFQAFKRLCIEVIRAAKNPNHVTLCIFAHYLLFVHHVFFETKASWMTIWRWFISYEHLNGAVKMIARAHCKFFWMQLFWTWNFIRVSALCRYIYIDIRDYLFNSSEEKKLNAYQLSYNFNHEKCPICLNEFDIETAETLLFCGHRYHKACIDKWEYLSTQRENYNIKCAMCGQSYSNHTKWDYIFDPNALYFEVE